MGGEQLARSLADWAPVTAERRNEALVTALQQVLQQEGEAAC